MFKWLSVPCSCEPTTYITAKLTPGNILNVHTSKATTCKDSHGQIFYVFSTHSCVSSCVQAWSRSVKFRNSLVSADCGYTSVIWIRAGTRHNTWRAGQVILFASSISTWPDWVSRTICLGEPCHLKHRCQSGCTSWLHNDWRLWVTKGEGWAKVLQERKTANWIKDDRKFNFGKITLLVNMKPLVKHLKFLKGSYYSHSLLSYHCFLVIIKSFGVTMFSLKG